MTKTRSDRFVLDTDDYEVLPPSMHLKELVTATGLPVDNAAALASTAGLQVDKTEVDYTDKSANPNTVCATCAFFVQPGGCQRVKGIISDRGWCKLYDSDKAKRLANWGVSRETDPALATKEFASDAQRRAFFGNLANDTLSSGGDGGKTDGSLSPLEKKDVKGKLERIDQIMKAPSIPQVDVKKGDYVLNYGMPDQVQKRYANGDIQLSNGGRQPNYGPKYTTVQRISQDDAKHLSDNMDLHRANAMTTQSRTDFINGLRKATKSIHVTLTNLKSGLEVLHAPDGSRFMFSITSNSYKDREGEAMTTKALSRYVESAWKDNTFVAKQPVYFWHEDDLPAIGNVVWADMEGPFLIEVFKEAKNGFAKQVWDYVEAHPKDFGTSHGFDYPVAALDDQDVYHDIDKFESSVLPHFAAANQYTVSTVIGEKSMSGTSEKDQYLDDKILGRPGAAKQLRRVPQAMHKALTEAGIAHKEKAVADDMQQKLQAHISKITADPELQAKLHQTIAAHHAATAGAMGAGEPDGDEADAWGAKEASDDDMDEETKEDSEGNSEAEDEEDTENRRGDEKSQPGYAEPDSAGFPVMTPALVTTAITKQPGSFPPPLSPQKTAGKGLNYVTQAEMQRGMKEIHDAIGELVALFDQQRSAPPSYMASSDPLTVIDNPAMLKAVKNINEPKDSFWHIND